MFEQNVSPELVTGTITATQEQAQKPLRASVKQAVTNYLSQLNGQDIENFYDIVLAEVEAPLLEEVMLYTRGNQTRAANMLGINRGTLRKKLKQYGMN